MYAHSTWSLGPLGLGATKASGTRESILVPSTVLWEHGSSGALVLNEAETREVRGISAGRSKRTTQVSEEYQGDVELE